MKKLFIFAVAAFITASMGFSTAAFSGSGGMGGLGMHHASTAGGVFGTSPATPGTNSLGTALSGGGAGSRMKGPELGTGNPAVDREDARVARMVQSICRGC